MKEEKVTINILKWLESNNWKIICYDFPQSGTGIMIHPNSSENRTEKNKGAIIPDIIAVKDSIALFFENKDRFVKSDFDKVKEIKLKGNYTEGLQKLLNDYDIQQIYYGIGIPSVDKELKKSLEYIDEIDFLISTEPDGLVSINYDKENIFA